MEENNTEKQKSLTKNTIYYLIYNVLNILFPLITGVYVARILLPTNVGEIAYAQNIAQYFVILAFLGIPTYGLREISKHRNNQGELNKLFTELFIINAISTVAFLSIYLGMIFLVPAFRNNLIIYLVVGISIALNFLNISWLYEGLEEFRFISLRNIIFKAACFILLIIFVRKQEDYLNYAIITVLGTAGNYLINMIFSRKYARFDFKGIELKKHMKSIMFLVMVNLAIEIYTLVDTTMLGIFCEKEHVAFYSYGSKIQKILLQIINTFTMVLVPRISLYYKEGKIEEYNKLLSHTFKIIIFFALPMIVGIMFVSKYMIEILYSSTYQNSADVLRILSVLLLISPIGYLLGSRVLLVTGHENKMIIAVGSGAVVNVIGNLILIPLYKEFGAAIASVIGELVVMSVYIFLGHKYFKMHNVKNSIIKIAISCVIMGLCVFGLNYINVHWFEKEIINLIIKTLMLAGIGSTLYFIIMLALRENIVLDFSKKIFSKFKGNHHENC